jgi:hypothetical protein
VLFDDAVTSRGCLCSVEVVLVEGRWPYTRAMSLTAARRRSHKPSSTYERWPHNGVGTDREIKFSRTFDDDASSPIWNDRDFPGNRGSLHRRMVFDHQECGRTRNQRQFRSSGERHHQRLVPGSLPTERALNRLLRCFVPPRSDLVRNLVPRSLARARKLTAHLAPSSSAVCHKVPRV